MTTQPLWTASDVAAATGKLPKIPADDIVVIGRTWDTDVAKNWPGHMVLDMPNTPPGAKPKPGDWSIPANDRWVKQAIDQLDIAHGSSPGVLRFDCRAQVVRSHRRQTCTGPPAEPAAVPICRWIVLGFTRIIEIWDPAPGSASGTV